MSLDVRYRRKLAPGFSHSMRLGPRIKALLSPAQRGRDPLYWLTRGADRPKEAVLNETEAGEDIVDYSLVCSTSEPDLSQPGVLGSRGRSLSLDEPLFPRNWSPDRPSPPCQDIEYEKRIYVKRLDTFEYAPLADGSIRLMRPVGTALTGEEVWEMQHFSESEAPAYKALSYCWCDEDATATMVCNGHRLAIRPNLAEALFRIRTVIAPQWFWVDAVCIFQADYEEKARMVARMGTVYQRAHDVIVWLGKEEHDSASALRLMSLVGQAWASVRRDQSSPVWQAVRERFTEQGKAFFEAISRIIQRDWFRRLWVSAMRAFSEPCHVMTSRLTACDQVVQEITLASSIFVLCGVRLSLWADLMNYIDSLHVDTSMMQKGIWPFQGDIGDPQVLERLRILRASVWHPDVLVGADTCCHLVLTTSGLRCKEPLDRVYVIRALLPRRFRERLDVEYSPSAKLRYFEKWISLVRLLVDEGGCSAVNILWRYVPMQPRRDLRLPSWCLDLSIKHEAFFSGATFSAGRPRRPSERGHDDPRIPFSIGPWLNCIEAHALVIGHVAVTIAVRLEDPQANNDQVSPSASWARRLLDIDIGLRHFTSWAEKFGLSVDARAKALSLKPWSRTPDSLEESYRELDAWLQIEYTNSILNRPGPSPIVLELLARFSDEVLFLTSQGLSGWVPRQCVVAEGDLLAVFTGLNYPVVVRAVDVGLGGPEEHWKIVGPAFVHNIMHGEVFEMLDLLPEQTWSKRTIW